MNMLFITGLKEYLPDIAALLRRAAIPVYSVTGTTGFKTDQPADLSADWFAAGSGVFDSVCVFSFTGQQEADTAMALIRDYNQQHSTGFPLRAFILPVADHSH
ncbi:MAG TPA: hypothetical protein VHE34_27685 [Puia sp.]|uniref:hypothetical protein n=1 Tax=Puia sp. TaxID=2045100 RepID=UPI002BEB5278|nr:hypothetical protein [Puia sp.]HVU99047.1 hypothetical protein [Puia sp.]